MGSESAEVVCPSCGNGYQNIGNHWNMSSRCDHPEPTARQHQLITGILFGGGTVIKKKDRPSAFLTTTSTRREFIDWLDDEFGILSRGIVKVEETADVRRDTEGLTDAERDALDSKDIYRWRTRQLPWLLDRYFWRWREDDGSDDPALRVPDDLYLTPLVSRLFYAKRGNIREVNRASGKVVEFSVTRVPASDARLADLFAPYAPRIAHHRADGVRYLRLFDAVRFFEDIGYDPLPGFEERWPDDDTGLATRGDEDWGFCPSCHGQFPRLSVHWGRSDCGPPPIDDATVRLVEGVLAGRGEIHAVEEGNVAQLILRAPEEKRHVLDWVSGKLGSLSRGVTEVPDADNQGKRYVLKTWGHPAFRTLYNRWYASGTKRFPDDLPLSSELVTGIYVRIGEYGEVAASARPLPYIPMAYLRITPQRFARAFEQFDPLLTNHGRSTVVALTDSDSFSEYLGSDVPLGVLR